MKLSIKTAVLQEMVSRSIKGAGLNKLIPLTSLMSISVKDKQLKLITTDASNTLYIQRGIDVKGTFDCVVQAEPFAKIVSKITSENITLELVDATLVIKGNGTYKIELPLDENGETITYPDPIANLDFGDAIVSVNLATIKSILSVNKAALATSLDEPVYTGYYVGDKVITTDTYKICGLDTKIFESPVLISPEMMGLLDVMTADKISVYDLDGVLVFVTDDCIVYGHKMEGIDDFAIEPISELLDEEFESSCKIRTADALALLDRISLFVGVYDNHLITLTFTDKGIDVSSKQSTGVETLEYADSKNFKPYTCTLDITLLTQQIKANSADMLELQYGNERSVKLIDGNVTQIIALSEDAE